MEFLNDLISNLQSYYNYIVAVTPKLALALLILAIAWFIATRVKLFAGRRLKTRLDDPLLAEFISNLIKVLLIIVGFLMMLRIVGLSGVAGSILAGAGISAFIIGFALKDIGENFLAGILLAFKRPFSVGDIIESNGVKGKVQALNLRDTQIKSDGREIYIPNALLIKNPLINYNRGGYLLQDFTVGLEYGSDYDKAIALVEQILEKSVDVTDKSHKNTVVISGIIGTAPQLNVRYWVRTEGLLSDGKTRSKILIQILNTLKNEGFNVKKD